MTKRLSNVDMNLLLPLQALLRERSVTKAAAQIGMSQPAMSSALKRLRRVLGDPLLVRAHGSYHLTPRARQLVRPLDDALRVIDEDVLPSVPFDPANSTRVFRIAASSSTAFAALRPVITSAAQSYPNISFAIVAPTRWPDRMFQGEDLDLILLPEVLPSEQPRERLYEEEWVMVVSADHPEVGDAVTMAQLYALPHVVFEDAGLRTHGVLTLTSGDRSIRNVVVADDFMMIFHLVPSTPLIAVVQGTVARELATRNGLRIVESPIPLPTFGIDMVWNPVRTRDQACQWLGQQLRTAIPPAAQTSS